METQNLLPIDITEIQSHYNMRRKVYERSI